MHCSIVSIILNPSKCGMIFLQQSFTHFPSVTSFSVSISATSFLINSFTTSFALYSAISSALILSEPGIFLSSEKCLSFSSPISVSHLFGFFFSVYVLFCGPKVCSNTLQLLWLEFFPWFRDLLRWEPACLSPLLHSSYFLKGRIVWKAG